MMQGFWWYLKVSRPRFWLYAFGPFLIGAVAAGQISNLLALLLLGLYFTLPANLLIYGVNDIFDYETDRHNPKKQKYEELVTPDKQKKLAKTIFLLNLPVLLLMPFLPDAARWGLVGFIFFGVFYSARPIRAKTKPVIDTLFNILYVFPGVVSYGLLTGAFPPTQVLVAATLWCMAMHAYSAVPDIEADRTAKIRTVATFLGTRGTLAFCMLAYFIASILAYRYLTTFAAVAGAVYLTMMIMSLVDTDRSRVFALYKTFPYINMAVGAGLFFWVATLVK